MSDGKLKVEQTTVIGGVMVSEVAKFQDIVVFSEIRGSYDYGEVLYFTRNGAVIQKLEISADMAQGTGFVSDMEWSKGV